MEQIARPSGEVELLVGYDYAGRHPIKELCHEHLLLLNNQFGKCFMGNHPSVKECTQKYANNVLVVNYMYKYGISSDFFSIESMGVSYEPKCGNCLCRKCSVGGKSFTLKEEKEFYQIESGLSFHSDHWVARYPWKKDPHLLPNNYTFAVKMLINMENRIKGDPVWEKTCSDQVLDMVKRKVARKLPDNELNAYKGPVHYICHHAVVKTESKLTPVPIIFNSSANFQGHVLNDYWVKDPEAFLNNLLGIILRFRENYVVQLRRSYPIRSTLSSVSLAEYGNLEKSGYLCNDCSLLRGSTGWYNRHSCIT